MPTTLTETVQNLRKRAEEKFLSSGRSTLKKHSPENKEHLFHELQVHQIELEMQIEELRHYQKELETSKSRYFDLYDLAPVGYLTINDKGLIVEANLAAATMLCVSPATLLKKPFIRHISVEDQDAYYLLRKAFLSSPQQHVWEMRFVRADGSTFWVRLHANSAKGGEFWVSFNDISAEKKAKEALQTSRRDLKATLDATDDGILTVNAEGKILFSSKRFAELWHIPQELIVSGDDSRLLAQVLDQLSDPDSFQLEVQRLYASRENSSDLIGFKDGRVFERHSFPLHSDDTQQIGRVWSFRDITERKRFEMELAESHTMLANAARITHLGTWQWNISDNSIIWSAEQFRILGLPATTQPSYDLFFSSVLPEDHDRVKTALTNALNGIAPYSVECRAVRPDGEVRYIHCQGEVLRDDMGQPVNMTGTILDTTERRQAEMALIESEALYHSLVVTSQDLIWRCDAEGIYTYLNPAWELVFGYKLDEMLGKHFFDFQSPKSGERTLKEHHRIMAGNSVIHYETIHIGKAGNEIHLVFNAQYNCDAQGSIIGTSGTAYDISERKQAEAALKQLTDEHAIILEYAGVGITFARNRHLQWVNPSFARIFGYSVEEMTGASSRILYHSDEAYEKFGKEAYSLLASGEAHTVEMQIPRNDGTLFHARFTGKAINPQNVLDGCIWILSDETIQKELESEILKSRDAADSANRAKSDFLANMSHEIRTPMNGVIGMTQLLGMTDLTKEQRRYVDTLASSGKSLLTLINDVLDLSKIESGKVSIEMEDFSLKDCIHDVVQTQKYVAYQKGLSLRVNLPDDLPGLVTGDQLRIKQIIVNLIGNAIKFTEKGDVTLTLQVIKQLSSSALIQFSVQDTGMGISGDAFEEIFKPFSQESAATSRLHGGTGLGLTISQNLAELMDGKITVESTQGVGSCFTLTVPFSVVNTSAPEIEAHTESAVIWEGKPLRILLVEDNPANIIFHSVLLKKIGHDVVVAENGIDCLALYKQGAFDLILMDIHMPLMNGEEALREIRKKEEGTSYHQPVIALTAYSLRGDKERFIEGGFDGYVSKPLEVDLLIAEMKRVLEM